MCATTPSLLCWFPVLSILCVLFCSEARHTPWVGSVLYVFILISKNNVFFNALGNSQSSNCSLVSPTFRFWLTHGLDAIDSIFLTNLVWLSGWHVALSTILNQPWRCSEPAGCVRVWDSWPRPYVSLRRVCEVYFNTSPLEHVWRRVQRTETTIHDDWKRFQRAFELASAHHFTSFLCVLIPLRDVWRCLLIFAQTSYDQTSCFYRTTPQTHAFNVSWEEFLDLVLNHYWRKIIWFKIRKAHFIFLIISFSYYHNCLVIAQNLHLMLAVFFLGSLMLLSHKGSESM